MAAVDAVKTADDLLREWALKHFKEESQKKINDYANTLKWRTPTDVEVLTHFTLLHLVNCSPGILGVPDHEWVCGCYSEYTRDDDWFVHSLVTCKHRLIVDYSVSLSPWTLPDVLQELAESDEGCGYDDPDY